MLVSFASDPELAKNTWFRSPGVSSAIRVDSAIAGTWVVDAPRAKLAAALSTEGAAKAGSSNVTGAEYRFGDEELAVYGEYELQTL